MRKMSPWLRVAPLAALAAAFVVAPAFARPPTSSINPGYDRRLRESRAVLAQPALAQPATPAPLHRHHVKHGKASGY